MTITFQRARRAALLTAAALAVAALTACAAGGAGGKPTIPVGDPSTLNIGYSSDPAAVGFDPAKYSGGAQAQFFDGFYETLFVRNPAGPPTPGLVAESSYNKDFSVMTLKLKPGVTFSDGSVLDAALVKANLNRRSDPSLVGYLLVGPGGGDEIKSVDVVAPDTVALTLVNPNPTFDSELTGAAGTIVGKSAIEDPSILSAAPVGSGPYTLDKGATVVGNSYTLVKNDESDVAASYPFKTIVFKPIGEPQARLNALISGQIDAAPISPTNSDLATSKGLDLATTGGAVMSLFAFDKVGHVVPAFGEEKVRQAIQYAIDRKSLVKALHPDDVAAFNALPRESAGFDKALDKKWAYDPAKAKQLLKEAGYADGFKFTIIAGPEFATDTAAVQKNLADVGITMDIKAPASTSEGFDAVTTTPLGMAPLDWSTPAGVMSDVFLGFANPWGAKDAELEAATKALDENGSKDKKSLKALNARLVESGWDIPLYELVTQPTAYNGAKLSAVAPAGSDLLSMYVPAK
ncbi:ABC transporter substrate-binding protein [Microbacterium deminutum]|uniref:ABC transporter substrate-binding protein n=1 Tax=Microbacterium deminutum TaxID=344164 RepID=A0ABP5CIV1_9MICO